MDLNYKIYSVYLYDNQLDHEYVFFHNKGRDFIGNLNWDAPYMMFGSSSFTASNKIYNFDKKDPNFKDKSIEIMKSAAEREKILFIKNSNFISLVPTREGRVSYSGSGTGDLVKDGEYKGLRKQTYTPYDIFWNETKSGINPHLYDVMSIWNPGQSQYSSYRIWETKEERISAIRESKLNIIL